MITRLVAGRAVVQGLTWGAVFGLYTYASAAGYAASYRTAASRAMFARSLGDNSGLTMLMGRGHRIDTVAGFTEWRGVGILGLVAGVWGVLAATRLLRGEEECGRWELLLAGPTTRRRAAVQATGGLAVGWLALAAVLLAATVLVNHTTSLGVSDASALAYAAAISVSAAVFLAVGVLTSQLAHSRRHAAMAGGGALGLAVVLRMLADSSRSLHWLAGLTPLGWTEWSRPLTATNWTVLLLPVAVIAALIGAAWWLAGVRDVGVGVLERPDAGRAHVRLLNGPVGLGVRTTRAVALGWLIGLATLGMLFGLVAKAAAQAAADSAEFRRVMAQLGGPSNGAAAYLGVTFVVGATLVMLAVGARIADMRDEEASGRLEHLLVRPVSRIGWFAQRIVLASALALVCAETLALGEWIGAAVQQSNVGISRLLVAGVNAIPVVLAAAGISALAFGLAPRRTAFVVYGVAAWSFLVEFVAQLVSPLHWLRGTSLLYHMTPAPAADPNWASSAALLAIGAVCACVGLVAFARRDLVGD